ncbi:MAG: IS1595 family transposase [Sphingopyxis sp.]|nr:IS1595 family transposase [Sphingopyxis sp.]
MSNKPQTIAQFFKRFPNEETCLNHLFDVRFGQGFECPRCERASKWFRIKAERAYSCQWCGHHLHPTVGTPFEKTRTPLQSWFYAIFLFTTTRNGVAAKELQRQLGVTYKTAWRMADLIRKHMGDVDGEAPLGGFTKHVEVDETIIGGKTTAEEGRMSNKSVVIGMLERGGKVMTKVVPNQRRATLLPIIKENVKLHSIVHTDELSSYQTVNAEGYFHMTVNHGAGEYVSPQGSSVNGIESFWGQLKRSIAGTYIHVSAKHLEKYAKEAEYRFNRRSRPSVMLDELLSTFGPLPERRG